MVDPIPLDEDDPYSGGKVSFFLTDGVNAVILSLSLRFLSGEGGVWKFSLLMIYT